MGRRHWRGNKDGNHGQIVTAILCDGWTIVELNSAEWSVAKGPDGLVVNQESGVADLLCLRRGESCFLEVKDRKAATGGQQAAREQRQLRFLTWCESLGMRGAVVSSPEEALAALAGPEALKAWREQARACACGHPYGVHEALGGACGVAGHSASRRDAVSGARVIVWKGCKCFAYREPAPKNEGNAKSKKSAPADYRARKKSTPTASYTPPDTRPPCPRCKSNRIYSTEDGLCASCLLQDDFTPPHA